MENNSEKDEVILQTPIFTKDILFAKEEKPYFIILSRMHWWIDWKLFTLWSQIEGFTNGGIIANVITD